MARYQPRKRCVLLTGAASGIGAALADELARNGAHLALVDRDREPLEVVAAGAARYGGKVSVHVVDLAKPSAVTDLEAAVFAEHDHLAGLVNNAGVAMFGDFEEIRADDFDWLMRINFHAPVELVRMALPHLRLQPDAVIVNMSSIFGIVAPAGQSAYSASKFALRGFSEALMHELAPSTVRVLTVHPGGVRTSIVDRARIAAAFSGARAASLARRFEKFAPTTPAQAARQITQAMLSGRRKLLIGADARVMEWLQRIAPVGYWRLAEGLLDAGRDERQKQKARGKISGATLDE